MTTNKEYGFSVIEGLMAVAAIAIIGVAGFLIYQHNQPRPTGASGGIGTKNQTTNQQTNTTPTTITYISKQESGTFTYPSNWIVTKPYISSNNASNTDQIGLQSPSGAITISYVTDLEGFGNETNGSYPYNTIINKTAIDNAPHLYVVSGITTLDGTTYYPWIAVQDTSGILTTGVHGDLATFAARRVINPSTHDTSHILFATCGARTTQNSPALTKDQATAWFSSADAQQAKQILLSLNDAQ